MSLRDFALMFENPTFQRRICKNTQPVSISFVAFHYRFLSINREYFKECYEIIKNEFIRLFRSKKKKYLNFIIDSTIISVPNKVFKIGYQTTSKGKKKQIKFTIVFNGDIPVSSDCYTEITYNSENSALKETILAIKDTERVNENAEKINFIFDRGLQSRDAYDKMTDQDISFIGRIQSNHCIDIIRGIPSNKGSNIKKQVVGYLYGKGYKNKTRHLYRVITFPGKDTKEDMVVATNIPETDISAQKIAALYRERWDIEVFFRFIKQTLDFSHLVNRSENGIISMMYIKLTCAILLIAFGKLNNIKGYKDTKRALSLVILKEFARLVTERGPPLK